MALMTGAPKPSEPSRFERIKNGDRDHINGYDDGEGPERRYADSKPTGIVSIEVETAEYQLNK